MEKIESVSLRFSKNAKQVVLEENLYIYCRDREFIIPKGFSCDLASVHRSLWWFVSKTDWCILIPSLTHDYFYRTKKETRLVADNIFFIKMLDFNMNFFKALLIYSVVRLFGKKAYNK